MNREILISLGISTLGTLLVLFYLRNKINDVESKVELMFQLIQNHENERKMANKIKVSEMENIAPSQLADTQLFDFETLTIDRSSAREAYEHAEGQVIDGVGEFAQMPPRLKPDNLINAINIMSELEIK